MIRSMTGYGRGETANEFGHISVEVKSFNSKNISITVRLPDILSSYEHQAINYVKSRIKRGQINAIIELNRDGLVSDKKVLIDHDLAKDYYNQLESLRNELSFTDPISLNSITSFPGVISLTESKEDIEQIWLSAYQALVLAFDQLIQMREKEGLAMMSDILERLDIMCQAIDRIGNRSPLVVVEYRQRLQKKINDLLQDQTIIDESRLAVEIAVMADRCDVSEEIVRLRSHISQIKENLKDSNEQIGRQLDFILQEINREANTVSSKADDYQISSDCIQLKFELEKIREQAQNIE
ncbi:MAG: YicC/YloC family endoribonuclease [Candidatus Poribacteria bacterium]